MESGGINDAAVDFYGKTLATCLSDGTIRIRSVDNPADPGVVLTGHQHPVWQVAWAHPRFGSILASCSFDRRVIVWRDAGKGGWSQLQVFEEHGESVNSIDWAPQELGLILACGSSDSTISIFTARQGNPAAPWDKVKIESAHEGGVTSVSWAPSLPPGSLVSPQQLQHNSSYVFKLASCGCDNTVKVWKFSEGCWKMDCFPPLSKHSDWVRDVAWAPNLGLPRTTMASASQDGTVIIWTQDHSDDAGSDQWQGRLLHDFKAPVWRVRWSTAGSVLAVTDGSNGVSLWKEFVDGNWSRVHAL